MNAPKMNRKFRSYFHYVVKQKLHGKHYGVNRIRVVLIEFIDPNWANHSRINARHLLVSRSKASRLFWFTTSKLFESKVSGKEEELLIYLEMPEEIFRSILATPEHDDTITQEEFLSLIPN